MNRPFILLVVGLCCLLPGQGMAQSMTQNSFRLVNTSSDEAAPSMSPDGKVLYWTVAHHPSNVGGKKDPGDIWYSIWTGEEWSLPIHGGRAINNEGYNAVVGFSHDGNRLLLTGHYQAGSPQPAPTQGIAMSIRSPEGWSFPENIHIPYFMDKGSKTDGYLSTTVEAFVFSAESYNTVGAEDIYVSLLKEGKWSEPLNLGSRINTTSQELTPSISADGRYLFFSSNGRKGYGGFDVYYAERLDDTWQNWSEPVNMGANVNTEGRELYYRTYPASRMALFTSNHNSDGYGDIRYYRPPDLLKDSLFNQLPDTVVKMIPITRDKPITADEKIFRVFGKVTDSKKGQPLRATLTFHADQTYTVVAGADGKFTISIPSVNEYTIRVEASGFVGSFEKLDVRTYELRALEMNFRLQPIEIGTTVNLKSVLFQQSTATLLPESHDELDLVVSFLKVNPKVEIQLAGHTDNRGNPDQNQKLSQKRVETVKAYLVSQGINARRITGKGYGGSKPIAANGNEETRRLNRRVEFVIVKD